MATSSRIAVPGAAHGGGNEFVSRPQSLQSMLLLQDKTVLTEFPTRIACECGHVEREKEGGQRLVPESMTERVLVPDGRPGAVMLRRGTDRKMPAARTRQAAVRRAGGLC